MRALIHFVHNEVIGRIVNACTGNQREDAGNQVYRNRVLAHRGNGARDHGEREGRGQICEHSAYPRFNADQIGEPAERSGQTAEYKLGSWCGEQHGERKRREHGNNKLQNHANNAPPITKR